MIVELLGMPCAGKTTLIKGTHKLLEAEGVPVHKHLVRRRPPLTRGQATRLAARPSVALWCAANKAQVSSETGRIFLRSLVYTRELRATSGVHLLDEGPLKLGTTAVARSRLQSAILRGMPRPDLVVHVDCDEDVRIQRIRAKDKLHARGLSDENLRLRHQRGLRRIRWLLDAYGVPVLRIDTTHGGDHAWTLAARVRELTGTADPSSGGLPAASPRGHSGPRRHGSADSPGRLSDRVTGPRGPGGHR